MKNKFQLFALFLVCNLFAMLLISIFVRSAYTRLAYQFTRAEEQYRLLKKQKEIATIRLEQQKTPQAIALKAQNRGMKALRVVTLKE